jgi:hypothetical protein
LTEINFPLAIDRIRNLILNFESQVETILQWTCTGYSKFSHYDHVLQVFPQTDAQPDLIDQFGLVQMDTAKVLATTALWQNSLACAL